MQSSKALISIVHDGARDIKQLQSAVSALRMLVNFKKFSSVYEKLVGSARRQLKNVSPIGQSLCICAQVIFDGNSKELGRILKEIENQQNIDLKNQSVTITLLSFGDEVSMVPSLSLPHPHLHIRSDYLVPAVEVYPHFIHPVLEQELSEVQNNAHIEDQLVFYAQSKLFEDFS